jgi:heme oxygenase (biliverdin-producing, ferredoxin)
VHALPPATADAPPARPPTSTGTGTASLPERLREATRTLHARAERSGAMGALLAGRLPRERYLALLVDLEALYGALEPALEACATQPWLQALDRAALARRAALAADLAPERTATSSGLPGPSLPMLAYTRRLTALGEACDAALLAHVYTRYLGDLHGGQILQRRIAAAYPGIGTRFYEFGDDARVQALRGGLRAVLSGTPLGAAEQQQVVDEACWSFEQHARVFEALMAA